MHIFTPNHTKTAWLLETARHDPWLKTIIDTLESFGYEIRYPFLGGAGHYSPQTVQSPIPLNTDFIEAFKDQHQSQAFKAQIHLSPRFGKNTLIHTFIHELIHFWQDMHGLFLTPLNARHIIQPDLQSHIKITLLCEAMAATESIRASYRLKQAGHPQSWDGAFWSLNWHGLSKIYAADIRIKNLSEQQAAENLFHTWYKTGQRKYYEKRAFEGYKNHNKEHRNVDLGDLIALIPKDQRPSYLQNPDIPKLMIEYKTSHNNNWRDIEIGSPAYLWNRHINQDATK